MSSRFARYQGHGACKDLTEKFGIKVFLAMFPENNNGTVDAGEMSLLPINALEVRKNLVNKSLVLNILVYILRQWIGILVIPGVSLLELSRFINSCKIMYFLLILNFRKKEI